MNIPFLKKTGIKLKLYLGCIVLGCVLLFSGIISITQYALMNDYVSELIGDNIKSINTARELLSVSEQYNVSLMKGLVLNNAADTISSSLEFEDDEVISSFEKVSRRFITEEERLAADSVIYAYAAYMQVAKEADEVWRKGFSEREEWYFNRLQPVYLRFRGYMQRLTAVCQDALINNSQTLEDSYYRSLMFPLITMAIGLMMVFLFHYYLSYYIVNPILKIFRGVTAYRKLGSGYTVEVDSDDEIGDLNETVKDIVDLNQSYKRKLNQ